jgi:hypothetical protein
VGGLSKSISIQLWEKVRGPISEMRKAKRTEGIVQGIEQLPSTLMPSGQAPLLPFLI